MTATINIGQILRKSAVIITPAVFGAVLWAVALITGIAVEVIGGVFRFVLGVFVTLVSIATIFGFIIWLLTI